MRPPVVALMITLVATCELWAELHAVRGKGVEDWAAHTHCLLIVLRGV